MGFKVEKRLVIDVLGVYACFLHWGYLQELITSTSFDGSAAGKWTFSIVLNLCMAFAGMSVAAAALGIKAWRSDKGTKSGSGLCPPVTSYIRPAIFFTLASPFGYLSLRYLSYPTFVMVKSCKLIPVMIVSRLSGSKSYSSKEYKAALLITLGVGLYSIPQRGRGKAASTEQEQDMWLKLFGVALIFVNMVLDGLTVSAQDKINYKYESSSPFRMQWGVNLWCVVFMVVHLLGGYLLLENSELGSALAFCTKFPEVIPLLLRFGAAAAIGQLFVYDIISVYGGLTNTAVAMSRKTFTVLLSILLFKHSVTSIQLCGIGLCFSGMAYHQHSVADKRQKQAKLLEKEA